MNYKVSIGVENRLPISLTRGRFLVSDRSFVNNVEARKPRKGMQNADRLPGGASEGSNVV